MKSLLIYSIGPVQDFIRTARKGRDLWFGSWLLSELARAGAQAILRLPGCALVTPHEDAVADKEAGIANKLLVEIRGGTPPAEIAGKIEAAIRAKLMDLTERAFRPFGEVSPAVRDTTLAQIRDLPELAWAATTLEGVRYRDARRRAEALLEARKSQRPFIQPPWASPAPKSSLDGAREAVIPPWQGGADSRERRSAQELWKQYRLGRGERLCGVGLLKRWGEHVAPGTLGARVQSTSHVAAWNTRSRLPAGYEVAFERYVRTLDGLEFVVERLPEPELVASLRTTRSREGYDAHLLYETRLPDFDPTEPGQRAKSRAKVEQAAAALRRLFKSWADLAREQGMEAPPRPGAYYAVLFADGDHMGKILDGLASADENRALTQHLTRFARSVRGVVETEHHGHLVYAGGDDILALVPVETVLACAEALARKFEKDMGDAIAALGLDVVDSPTLSVGIAVAHHLDPLQEALEAARKAEKSAKNDYHRDAWVVTVSKRSGVPVTAGGKWERFGDLEVLFKSYRDEPPTDGVGLSRGLPYELEAAQARLSAALPGVTEGMKARLEVLWPLEAKRTFLQKGMAPGLIESLGEQIQRDKNDLLPLANRLRIARALTAMEDAE